MKPVLSYNIKDTKGNILFEFPPNSLLERIIDVWPIIIDYHENYFPFVVEMTNSNYRKITIEECKLESFVRLFSIAYRKKRITRKDVFVKRLCIDNIPLMIKKNISYLYINNSRIFMYNDDGETTDIINELENIYINESVKERGSFVNVSLMVLDDIVF